MRLWRLRRFERSDPCTFPWNAHGERLVQKRFAANHQPVPEIPRALEQGAAWTDGIQMGSFAIRQALRKIFGAAANSLVKRQLIACSIRRTSDRNGFRTKYIFMKILIVSLIASLPFSVTRAEDAKIPFEDGTKIEVVMAKPARTKGGDYDDQQQEIRPKLKLINIDTNQNYEGYNGAFIVIGQSAVDPKAYSALMRHEFTFSLLARKTFEEVTAPVTTRYDTTGAKFGYKYDGWILIIKDPSGKIVFTKATSSPHEKLSEKADKLAKGSVFNKALESTASPRF